ncbi:hypothetical protein G7054_g567 [Neopestalotiopsis clavispora]|nr:hypothetical protein G7054_g567 [Neopestalotiopsis clavispora]
MSPSQALVGEDPGQLVSLPIVPSLLLFLTVLAGLLLLLSRISTIRAARNFRKQHGCEPVRARVPLKDPIWGLDFIYEHLTAFREKRSLEAGANRFRTLGHTFAVDGLVRSISTTDPENIKSILSVNFKDYSHKGRQTLMKPLLGGGIFASDGAEWAHSRAMLRPNFTKDQVADLDVVGRHISHLIDAIPRNTTIDLQPLLLQFTLDSATEFLLGHSTNGLVHGDGEGEMFGAAFDASLKDIAYQFRLGPFRHLQWSRRKARDNYATCQRYVDRFVRRAMDLRKAESADDERNCFLKELAKSNEPEERIRDELLNILLAGRDTTASLLASFFFLVARRPDVWKKLRNEVNKLEGCSPTYEQLREMKFVRYCLNETLRLYPPVPGNGKVAVRDTVLPRGGGPGGDKPVYVPKGSFVNYAIYAMHRRQDFYGPDADEFRPERWETCRPSWEYLPFNGGPRICLGQQYALTESMLVVIKFAQQFSCIISEDSRPWTENLGLTMCVGNGVLVSFPSEA